MSNLETAFKSVFPKGFYKETVSQSTGSKFIIFGLIDDVNKINNRIRENDPMYHIIKIDSSGEKLVATLVTGSLSCLPLSPVYAMHCMKTNFRKTTGTEDKINDYLVKFFNRLHDLVIENSENIFNRSMYLDYLPVSN